MDSGERSVQRLGADLPAPLACSADAALWFRRALASGALNRLGQHLDTRQRLAAILAADVVGYSRLMALDEDATVAALDRSRHTFRTHIVAGRGRVSDAGGAPAPDGGSLRRDKRSAYRAARAARFADPHAFATWFGSAPDYSAAVGRRRVIVNPARQLLHGAG